MKNNSKPVAGLPKTAALCVALLFSGVLVLPAADIHLAAILKTQNHVQSGPHIVGIFPDAGHKFTFEAVVFGEDDDSLLSAILNGPGGGAAVVESLDPDAFQWGLEESYDSPLELDVARPDGGHTLHLVTRNDGSHSLELDLSGNAYPPIPRTLDFNSLQDIAAGTGCLIQWNGMGGGANDFILCSVFDPEAYYTTVFETPLPGEPGALDGRDTEVILPPGTLEPGRFYELKLMFVKMVDVLAPPAAHCPAFAGYARSTRMLIATRAAPGQSLHAGLERVIPEHGTEGVPRDSAASFHFTRAMTPSVESGGLTWTGSGLDPLLFSHEWHDGNRVLLCNYAGALPANATITWWLDLSKFKDANGFGLAGDVRSGCFSTSSQAPHGDPPFQFLVKRRFHRQNPGAAGPVSSGRFEAEAKIETNVCNSVLEPAEVTIPVQPKSRTERLFQGNLGNLELRLIYADQAEMDGFFPNGAYVFHFATQGDGQMEVTLDLGTWDDYPPTPTIGNLDGLQAADPTMMTPVAWDFLPCYHQEMGIGSCIIELEIHDELGEYVFGMSSNGYPGDFSPSGCLLPVGVLEPGRVYGARLSFYRLKDVRSDAGAGVAELPLVTVSRKGSAAELRIESRAGPRVHVIETSADLGRWLPQEAFKLGAAGSVKEWVDADAGHLRKRFYRLRPQGPGESPQSLRPNVTLQGRVWADGQKTQPLAGVVVGTTLDGRVATTGPDGGFFLETDTPGGPPFLTTPYGVRVTFGGETRTYTSQWGVQPRGMDVIW